MKIKLSEELLLPGAPQTPPNYATN